jgi:alpha-L-fucosidase
MLCSRIGHGMGDYESLGDMEVPLKNHSGLWETCDTTNDSWSYARYDQNWKDSKEILHRVVSTVGRGGTYPMGLISFSKPGKHKVSVSLVDGDGTKASLEAIRFVPAR